MRRIVTISLAAAAFAAAGTAYAQAEPVPAREPLTRSAVEQRSADAFTRMDANKDGKLDQADRTARQQERLARRDANSDGQVNEADRTARQQATFERVDTDRNGSISFEEFAAVREQRGELRAERRDRGPRVGARGARRAGMAIRGADTNGDGSVTQAEFASAALARFDRVDVDKDGTISADERPQRRMMRRERRAAPDAG